MRIIPSSAVVDAVKKLCIEAAAQLPPDVLAALYTAFDNEESPRAKTILKECLKNAERAGAGNDPICQDTGVAVFFVELGSEVAFSGGDLVRAINEGTRQGYRDGYLRNSMVADPLFDRTNTGDNTPAVIHVDPVPGETFTIALLPKGGGCENVSSLAMLNPSDGAGTLVDFVAQSVIAGGGRPCPPVIVGVGIGGTADKASLLAKKALLRPVGSHHSDKRYGEVEREILQKINESGIGPQGLGGRTTALAVHIETFPCHMASLPVAVNVNCHAARRMKRIL
ncbi:MAG: fumarate hydratase [Chitinispirillaceae bacterium]|nr:fumarate hydratase [Chitinispirillaceae bacterium]